MILLTRPEGGLIGRIILIQTPVLQQNPRFTARGDVRADALGTGVQVHVGRFWGLLGWDTFLVSDLGWETGFGLLSPS